MNQRNRLDEHFSEAQLDAVRNDAAFIDAVEAAGTAMQAIAQGGKISCGNGGSMSDAVHFAEELSGRYREDRLGLPAISCSDPSHITCVGNDYNLIRSSPVSCRHDNPEIACSPFPQWQQCQRTRSSQNAKSKE